MNKQTGMTEYSRVSEDRREGVRVDDAVMLEYWEVDENTPQATVRPYAQVPLAGAVDSAEGLKLDPLIVQWMSKIEWTLDAILRTLEHQTLSRHSTARLMDVNISGEGLRFQPDRMIPEGTCVGFRMVLPPFTVVEGKGTVFSVRVDSSQTDAVATVIVKYTDMSEEDREKIIRYAVQRQAELQRRRQRSLQVGHLSSS